MERELLLICGLLSVPFVCVYVFYSIVIMTLPIYADPDKRVLTNRLQSAIHAPQLSFVFLVPCLNEAKVIANTLAGILALPHRRVLIVVIDDASDDETAAVVRQLHDPRVRLLPRRLPNARRGKGDALNAAFSWLVRGAGRLKLDSNNIVVCIIDGDGRPSENLLAEAVRVFCQPAIGAAQARIRIMNRERLLPLMQDLEFAATVGAMQNAREYFGSVGLGGNGQFARLSALQTLGDTPWTDCLLEDFDIGLRLLLAGHKVKFLHEAYVAQQGLTSVHRFIRQRTRWVQGDLQCLRYAKQVHRSNLTWTAKLDVYYFLAQPWVNVLGTFIQMLAIAALIKLFLPGYRGVSGLHGPLVALRLVAWLFILFCPGFIWGLQYLNRYDRLTFRRVLQVGFFFPVYNALAIPSVWLALFRHFTKKQGWQKTERAADQKVLNQNSSSPELSNLSV